MMAPTIQRIGRKIPKKNIHPCPFLSVITPRVTNKTKYSKPPNPIPHHIVPPSCRFLESSVSTAPCGESQRTETVRKRKRRSITHPLLGHHIVPGYACESMGRLT
jgi:hypothetical protein